jgi:hypothetical protein
MERIYNVIPAYEFDKLHDINHIATSHFVVEDIYKFIDINKYKWFDLL